jgi:hypothetical protein
MQDQQRSEGREGWMRRSAQEGQACDDLSRKYAILESLLSMSGRASYLRHKYMAGCLIVCRSLF